MLKPNLEEEIPFVKVLMCFRKKYQTQIVNSSIKIFL